MSITGSLRTRLFGIAPKETTVAERGFRVDDPFRIQQLENVGTSFVNGYHVSMADTRPDAIAAALDPMEDMWRGFAYEGAGMGLAVLDRLTPWYRRVHAFLDGPGNDHLYMVHVGVGWAFARLAFKFEPLMARYEPIWRPLIVDGYGFHEGYFSPAKYYERQTPPKKLTGTAYLGSFHQGLGRALWFVEGCEPSRVAAVIARFPVDMHSHMWAGIGLASTYAGGVKESVLNELVETAGEHAVWLAQGCVFATKARHRAGNVVSHCETACRVLTGMSVADAVALSDSVESNLKHDDAAAYEVWRQSLCEHFQKAEVGARS